MPTWLKKTQTEYQLSILVAPRASSNRVIGEHNGALKIALTSPPVDGQANEALIAFLSKTFKIPKSCIEISKGLSSKRKTVTIPSNLKLDLSALSLTTV